jgi:hypothetical protein
MNELKIICSKKWSLLEYGAIKSMTEGSEENHRKNSGYLQSQDLNRTPNNTSPNRYFYTTSSVPFDGLLMRDLQLTHDRYDNPYNRQFRLALKREIRVADNFRPLHVSSY